MQTSCKECGKYKICSEAMPYSHADGVWHSPAEKRRWMKENCADCFISESMWQRVNGLFVPEDVGGYEEC